MADKLVRCAVYTRKSSEEGLEQSFNSLTASRLRELLHLPTAGPEQRALIAALN